MSSFSKKTGRTAAAVFCASIMAVAMGVPAAGADEASDLAKKLSNPLASMISVPFQLNYDQGFGSASGDQWLFNIQPVVPISLNDQWNLISRTIMPIKAQNNKFGLSGSQFGLGDTTQSLWFSPTEPTPAGLIWGVGPVFYLPTATDPLLGTGKWGAGPTAVGLIQKGPWTFGVLANHIWSFGGADINSTYAQPFLSYTTPNAWSYTLNTESTYNWNTNEWSVPINALVSKLVSFGGQHVSLQAGARYYAVSSTGGATGWGGRVAATFLFPR